MHNNTKNKPYNKKRKANQRQVKCDDDYDLDEDYYVDDTISICKIERDYNHGSDNYSNINVIKLSNINKVITITVNQLLYDGGALQRLATITFTPSNQ